MAKHYEQLLLICIFLLFFIFRVNILDATGFGSDLDYIRQESIKLSKGESIYSRILKGSLTNEEASGGKLPVLLPSVYYFIQIFTNNGSISLEKSYDKLQFLILFCDVISSIFIYAYLKKQQGFIVALSGMTFFLFNRWSTNAFFGAYFDSIALMFLIISLYYLGKKNIAAALLLSISILFKHFGLFVLPIYFVYWLNKSGFKNTLKYILIVIIPVIITVIPSALTDFKGFFYSIMFNFTRKPDDNFLLPFMDNVSHFAYQKEVLKNRFIILMINRFYFILSYLPILYMMYKNKFSVKIIVFLVFFWFFLFNSKAFPQYFVWFIGTGILALGDFKKNTVIDDDKLSKKN